MTASVLEHPEGEVRVTSLVDHRQFPGIGRAVAEPVLSGGHKLVATTRNPPQLADLVERYRDHVPVC